MRPGKRIQVTSKPFVRYYASRVLPVQSCWSRLVGAEMIDVVDHKHTHRRLGRVKLQPNLLGDGGIEGRRRISCIVGRRHFHTEAAKLRLVRRPLEEKVVARGQR